MRVGGLQHWPVLALVALQPAGRYVVTAKPIDTGVGYGHCIAIDTTDPQGVWLWEPGNAGCANSSNGPETVRHADRAAVSRAGTAAVSIAFRIAVISTMREFVDVKLVLENDKLRVVEPVARPSKGGPVPPLRVVATARRNDLNIPESR